MTHPTESSGWPGTTWPSFRATGQVWPQRLLLHLKPGATGLREDICLNRSPWKRDELWFKLLLVESEVDSEEDIILKLKPKYDLSIKLNRLINIRPYQPLLASLPQIGRGGWGWRHVLLPMIQDGTLHTTDKTINEQMSANRTQVV